MSVLTLLLNLRGQVVVCVSCHGVFIYVPWPGREMPSIWKSGGGDLLVVYHSCLYIRG